MSVQSDVQDQVTVASATAAAQSGKSSLPPVTCNVVSSAPVPVQVRQSVSQGTAHVSIIDMGEAEYVSFEETE